MQSLVASFWLHPFAIFLCSRRSGALREERPLRASLLDVPATPGFGETRWQLGTTDCCVTVVKSHGSTNQAATTAIGSCTLYLEP